METITAREGTVMSGGAGQLTDTRKEVQFEGELLGERIESSTTHSLCGDASARGVTETLYKASDGRLLVDVFEWSQRPGDPIRESLREISEADLRAGGSYALLGAECGYGDRRGTGNKGGYRHCP